MNTHLAGAVVAVTVAVSLGASAAHAWPTSTPVSCGCPTVHHHAVHPTRSQVAWRRPAPTVHVYRAEGAPPYPPQPSLAYGGPGPAPYPAPSYGAAFYAPAVYGPSFGGAVVYRSGFHRAAFRAWPRFHGGFGVHGARAAWRGAGRPWGRRFG